MSEEKIVNYFKEVLNWYRENTPDRVYALNNKDIEMIQGLLKLYQQEKEKNKNLLDTNKKLYEMGKQTAIQELINNDYVRKDKIIEKIEEYEDTYMISDIAEDDLKENYKLVLTVLQELLEE